YSSLKEKYNNSRENSNIGSTTIIVHECHTDMPVLKTQHRLANGSHRLVSLLKASSFSYLHGELPPLKVKPEDALGIEMDSWVEEKTFLFDTSSSSSRKWRHLWAQKHGPYFVGLRTSPGTEYRVSVSEGSSRRLEWA
ncbi:anhydro-N-acetylmuramic acid kinase, partial [Striga asiatica]